MQINNLQLKGSTDYSVKTAGRNTYIKSLNIYTSKLLSSGNSKLSKDILIFDLLAVESCINCTDCAKTCYALKAQRQYPDTYNKRAINTWLAKNDLGTLETLLTEQLNKTKKSIVRIHSAGDFFSVAYINMWDKIALKFPKINFYYYTKVSDNSSLKNSLSHLKNLSNVNQVESFLPDGTLNYGPDSYVQEKNKKWNAPICPYGYMDKVVCGETCKLCLHEKYILFKQH